MSRKPIQYPKERGLKKLSESPAGRRGSTPLFSSQCRVCGSIGNFTNYQIRVNRSCGCVRTSHGHTKEKQRPRLMVIRGNMLSRCRNHPAYAGRVRVCASWRRSYQEFYQWAVANGYQEHKELDRIDNNGDYTPGNCRWVTHTENMRNTRRSRLSIEVARDIKRRLAAAQTKASISRELRVPYHTVMDIARGKNWADA